MSHLALNAEGKVSLLEFLRKLVRTSSPSGSESVVAELVMNEMRRLRFHNVTIDAAGNVIGRVGPAEGPALMLNSHMDTVTSANPEAWRCEPLSATLEGTRLYGLGACDMKGGLAATIYGAAMLAQQEIALKGPILVACVGLEEPAEGTGTRVLFEEDGLKPDWVVIAEPSNLQIARAQRGHIEMELSVRGRSAHSSSPQLGDNAIYAASRLIFGMEILAEQLGNDPFVGAGVLAVTDIRSHAVSRNAVPDGCTFIIDRRLTIGETESSALLEVQRVIAREGVNATIKVIEESVTTHTGKTYKTRRASLPWVFPEQHPLVQAAMQAGRDVGLRPGTICWSFATEGAHSAAVAQVPTIGFGPGDPARAHTVNEFVDVEQVYAAAEVYAALGLRLLRK
ncbi:MAG: YgeY family selenium metabolism-linked hydrolase [Anaerolineae bacterium]|nr:YgeY family selenium metabolism-linked hydrolase [Anaerolineae bacterium]